ncbi:MAG: hypothetical protein OSB01_05245 [Nitrosomonadaceae bacterium]|nr:hypothetical protein [Nitrosomonadaceae bacterium]
MPERYKSLHRMAQPMAGATRTNIEGMPSATSVAELQTTYSNRTGSTR